MDVEVKRKIVHSRGPAEGQDRKHSMDDINLDQFLKIGNYEDTVKELDIYYGIGSTFRHMKPIVMLIAQFFDSETTVAPISKPHFRTVSSVVNRHRSRKRSRQRLLCGGCVELVSGLQVGDAGMR